ncbi:hypothetical protein DFH28DRAFT_1188491 [Melampsora americana]|nr:hypothetical protein DFH28DRAFT_1188491 [Melampsora americana]
MHPTEHPTSCVNCLAAGEACTWAIVDSQLLRDRYQCDRCDRLEVHCQWTVDPPPPKNPKGSNSNIYDPPENESNADRDLRINAWVCKPDKPSDPKLRPRWIADVRLWNNGGNAPLPPQQTPTPPPQTSTSTIPTHPKTPPTTTRAESIHTPDNTPPPTPSPPKPSNTKAQPPSPPALSPEFKPPPPKASKNFIHKTESKNKYKKPKLKKNFQNNNKKFFSNQSSPFVVPDSPVDVKPDRKSTVEDLMETPPPSPLPTSNEHSFSTSTNTEDTTPDPSTSTSTDQPITESYPSITREGIDAFIREYGPGIIALTETIFNLFSTHWKLFPSNDPAELNARSNLVTAMKNVVALDVVYRAHPRPDLRPPHYDGITTGLPPHIIPSAAHASFYDDVAKDNFKFSAEEKGKKRARE